MSDLVRVETVGSVGRITLAAPDRLNALDPEMLDAVDAAIRNFNEDNAIRVISLTGEGRGFCSGANLAGGADGEVDDRTLYAAGVVTRALVASPKPTVALVNGVAAGVGVSLALACDYVLASDKASFVLAFAKIGLMPDGGATALVAANIGRARAMRMALTAEKVPAVAADAWGLVSETVPHTEFEARGAEIVDWLASLGPLGVAATKDAINAASLDLDGALEREEAEQARLLRSEDLREGVRAFNDKRTPNFRGK